VQALNPAAVTSWFVALSEKCFLMQIQMDGNGVYQAHPFRNLAKVAPRFPSAAVNFPSFYNYATLRVTRFRMIMQKFYSFRRSTWMIIGLLYASSLSAQFLTETLPDQDIGRPPQPPFITFLGILGAGKLVTDPSLPPVGPVVQTLYEELHAQETPAGPAGEVIISIMSTWDEAGHVIEEVRKDRGSESVTLNRYEGVRLVSQESTFPNSKRPKRWNYWTYDKSGKLIEYRRGSADEIENHDTNFKRDAQGRLISYEYRQGPKDELFSHTEWRYSADGKTVDLSHYDEGGAVTQSITQTVDDQGYVVMAVIRDRDWKTKQAKAPVNVVFRYDGTGRLIEQNTDAQEFDKSESEGELPSGKISITYDNVKHTKTTSYSGDEGSLVYTVTQDASGATIGFDGGAKGESLNALVHCTSDNYGNWTACQQTVKIAGVDKVMKMWRRKITYR
jgi:hypothetical protein